MLWNIFNTLQLLTALELLQVAMPANVKVLQRTIQETVNFSVIPKDVLYDKIITPIFGSSNQSETSEKVPEEPTEKEDGEETSAASQGLEELFNGENFLQSILVSLILFMALALCTVCLFYCRRSIMSKCWSPVKKLAKAIERKLMYNSVLRGLLEVYLMTAISMFNGLNAVSTYTIEEKISYLLALATAILCFYFPCWAFSFVRRNQHKLGKETFQRRYDSLY